MAIRSATAIAAPARRRPGCASDRAAVHNISVEVQDGVVLLQGYHRSPEAQRAAHVLAEGVEGVRAVDDQTRPAPPPYQTGFGGPI